jgi:hypothetical protein
MARLIRTLMFFALIFVARPAFAGGTCPSGANYNNPSNPTGSLVTLSSLGVTNCYFVAANGSDSNSGTSEASPWLHAPGMANCANNCSRSVLGPGVGIIFRGGDTWHFGNSGTSPYAGVVTNCTANGTVAAGLCLGDLLTPTSANPLYYGVDLSWFSGGSWSRPILTADNPLCNLGNANGTTCVSTTDTYGMPSVYVSSCLYQIGSVNDLVDVGYSKYVILDDFELTGLCLQRVGQITGDAYVRYGAAQGPLTFQNLYIHGSSHLKFAGRNTTPACTSSNVCTNMFAFQGSVNNGTVGETIQYNVIDFSDSDPVGTNLCFGGFYNVAYNAFRYTTSCVVGSLHTFHDNLYEYFFENGHSNLLESNGDLAGTNVVYNNVFRHIEAGITSGGGVGIWLLPPVGTTDYVFNNLGYDVGPFEYLNMGNHGDSLGSETFFNNTWQSNASQPIYRCENMAGGVVTLVNEHAITQGGSFFTSANCNGRLAGDTTPHFTNNSQARSEGYTSSQTFAYSPTSSGSPTVKTGTNKQSFCSALSSAGLFDAATACLSDTSYACVYSTSNHSVNCPNRTVATRTVSTAWDIGAYESNGMQANAPNPPSNITAVVQ